MASADPMNSGPPFRDDTGQIWGDGRIQCDVWPAPLPAPRRPARPVFLYAPARAGRIVLTTYGRSSGFCIDPVEKKPLNHFLPGAPPSCRSAPRGCNLTCAFCQNWGISKAREFDRAGRAGVAGGHRPAPPSAPVAAVSPSPTTTRVIFLEYAGRRRPGLPRAGAEDGGAVTAGYICDEPRVEFYRAHGRRQRRPQGVSRRTSTARSAPARCSRSRRPWSISSARPGWWFEITTLLIPGENDSDAELATRCRAGVVEALGPDVPIHFSAFHPDWKMRPRSPDTPARDALRRAAPDRPGQRHPLRLCRATSHDPECDSSFTAHSCGRPADRPRLGTSCRHGTSTWTARAGSCGARNVPACSRAVLGTWGAPDGRRSRVGGSLAPRRYCFHATVPIPCVEEGAVQRRADGRIEAGPRRRRAGHQSDRGWRPGGPPIPACWPTMSWSGMSTARHDALWENELRRQPGGIWVWEDGGRDLLGFGHCGPQRDAELGYEGEVYMLYVLPDAQGNGHRAGAASRPVRQPDRAGG